MSINDIRSTHDHGIACPGWCGKPFDLDAHDPSGYDSDGSLYRRHAAVLPDAAGQALELHQLVWIPSDGTAEELEPPCVILDHCLEHMMTSAQARELAHGLLQAAEILDGAR